MFLLVKFGRKLVCYDINKGVLLIVFAYRLNSINVIDLSSTNENKVYTMMYLIDIPNGTKISELQEVLSKKMADYGVTIGLRHQALFKMVNEI